MPTISKRFAAVANGASVFPFQNSVYEYIPFPAMMLAAIKASVAGCTSYFSSGTDVLLEPGSNVPVGTTLLFPDDFKLRDAVAPGDRMVCQITNSSGGAVDILFEAQFTPG